MATVFRLARDSREVIATFTVREGKAVLDYYDIAETVSLAVCRAALKATKGKSNE